jgi:hypothetical protein
MPPYDELWPAEFAPARPLELLDRKYSRQFRLEQARAFVWGQQPTVANFLPAHLHERSQEMALVMRLARLRSRAAKYLLYGEFFPPPEIHAPEATSDFSRLSIYAGQQDRLTSYQKRHPLALAGAWRAADGDMAVPLVNIGDDALSLSFAIDPACYGLPKRIRASRTDESGRRPIELLGGDAPTVKLELPPRDACVLELSGSE